LTALTASNNTSLVILKILSELFSWK
jgi:hypothetical protein